SRTALRYQTVRHGCKFSTTRQVVLAREWLEQSSPASPAHGPKAYRYRTKDQWSFCSRRSRLVPSQELETAPGQRYVMVLVLDHDWAVQALWHHPVLLRPFHPRSLDTHAVYTHRHAHDAESAAYGGRRRGRCRGR